MRKNVPAFVMNKLFNEGYGGQILDIELEEKLKDKEISDLPISPLILNGSEESIIFNEKVYEVYQRLVDMIFAPITPFEIPFFLLGTRKVIDGKNYIIFEDIIYNMEAAITKNSVSSNTEQFKELLNTDYSVISIGHTHNNVADEIRQESVDALISDEVKRKYSIRTPGLNISISDIWQHEVFKQLANGTKEIFQTIIMYNKDVIVINSSNISKANNIEAVLSDGRIINLPTGDSVIIVKKPLS